MSSNSQALTLANIQDRFRKALREENPVTNVLATLEAKTKVNREYLAYGKKKHSPFLVFELYRLHF
jgi:hypothetical protein